MNKVVIFHGAQLGFLLNELRRFYDFPKFYETYFSMFGNSRDETLKKSFADIIRVLSAHLVNCDLVTGFVAIEPGELDFNLLCRIVRAAESLMRCTPDFYNSKERASFAVFEYLLRD